MDIRYHIKHKHVVALYNDLKADPRFLVNNPDLRSAALNAFIRSHGVVSNHGYDSNLNQINPPDLIKMCVSDARKLCDLVKRGIFTYAEVKDLFPRDQFDVALAVAAKFPNWISLQDILEMMEPEFFMDDWSDMVRKEIRAIPGLKKALDDLKKIHEVHNS